MANAIPVEPSGLTGSGGALLPLLGLAVAGIGSSGLGSLGSWSGLKTSLRAAVENDPLDALAVTVLGGSFLFWLAERDHNPKCTSYFDALVFVSTSLSVGLDDVFAKTQTGKTIATALMTVGPALAAAALDPPGGPSSREQKVSPETLDVQRAMLDKLDAILVELREHR